MDNSFKIYTKTGDDGTSGLIGGTRVQKSDERLEAYGTVDELNSWIGTISTGVSDNIVCNTLEMVQNKLFIIGSHLATDESKSDLKTRLQCSANDAVELELEIDRMNSMLPALNSFILPGGDQLSGFCHIARTVCRRAERRIIALSSGVEVNENILVFINRLSDYLFVLSRFLNHTMGKKEKLWTPIKS